MLSSKLSPEVSIIIINSSHSSLDDVTAILRKQIDSGQRPHITYLTLDQLRAAPNLQDFLKTKIDDEMEKCRLIIEKSQRLKDFNQLDQWREEIEMRKGKNKEKLSSGGIKVGIRNQLSMKRDCAQNIIIDFPLEHEAIKLYLILFDVYDCEMIKALFSLDSSLKSIVNLYPRIIHNEKVPSIKSEAFWSKLLQEKFTRPFSDVAFFDLDVPIESRYMLNLRSKLIYDQFSHFFYDIENIKSSYKTFSERLEIVDVNVDGAIDDCAKLKRRLNEIPESMLTVEIIYDALLEQVASTNGSRKSSLTAILKRPFQVELFGKKFVDVNDDWRQAYEENPKLYAKQIEKMENSLHMWDDVGSVSLEKQQLLNYFMAKLMNILGDFHHLEFYIYALQFKTMEKFKEKVFETKNFYENRSVGRGKKATKMQMKSTFSDSNVDYKNQSKIPEEISQLVDAKAKFRRPQNAGEELTVLMFSSSAMLQHLTRLIRSYKSYSRQHFELLDVILLKFHKQPVPKMFTTNSYKKVLPTPLCFRDFNDCVEHELKVEMKENAFAQGDISSSWVKPQDFFLKSSLKNTQAEMLEDALESVSFAHSFENDMKNVEENICVFDVSNRRIQFHVTESEFNTSHITAKASNFNWLNQQRILNFNCQLHDVRLSISYDLNLNELQLVTLTNNNGMKFSLVKNHNVSDGTQQTLNRWNFSLTFPNGVAIKNLDNGAVEQCLLDGKTPDGETKRVLFPNGFVMILFDDGTSKLLASNGSIFEVSAKSRRSSMGIRKSQKDWYDNEATKLHQDSITSIHFLKDFISLSFFKMILPNGETFNVEHDSIIDKLETIESQEKLNTANGSLHIIRADGLKTIHTEAFSKCLFPDGTLITTWLLDDSIRTASDEAELTQSILEEIWSSESNNESKFIVNQVLNEICDDYFLNINSVHQVEHASFGAVRFDGKIKVQMFNDTTLEACMSKFLMILPNGVTFKIDDSEMRFLGEMCSECFSSNKAHLKFLKAEADDNEVLLSTRDFSGNTFEVKKSGRHAFYSSDTYDARKCQQCILVEDEYESEHFGERCVVVNRDNSGYEVKSTKVNGAAFSETFDELLFLKSQKLCFQINDKDVNIDIGREKKTSKVSIPPSPSENSKSDSKSSAKSLESRTQSKQKRRKITKSKSTKSEIIQPLIEESKAPQWLTEIQLIPGEISIEQNNLIRFYDNPLNELPSSNAVGPMIKLNNKFTDVTNAMNQLKIYSTEKFIFNVNGLMETPVGKQTLEENFKLVVRKTVENHIQEKLEFYRRGLADAVINDFFDIAMRAHEEEVVPNVAIFNVEIDEIRMKISNSSAAAATPVAMKSFSFS